MYSVTFRVNLSSPMNYPGLSQPHVALQRTIWLPHVDRPLHHGDTFTLTGSKAIYMRDFIAKALATGDGQNAFFLETVRNQAEEEEEVVSGLTSLVALASNDYAPEFSFFPMTIGETTSLSGMLGVLVEDNDDYDDLTGVYNPDDGKTYFFGTKSDDSQLSFFTYDFIENEKIDINLPSDNDAPPGNSIGDGGGDMYDDGNYLNTNLDTNIYYTHSPNTYNGVITSSTEQFGEGSSYFTNKYPYLFVLVAQNISITEFYTNGNLGADNSGQQAIDQFEVIVESNPYTVFYRKVWDASDPSVIHLIILPGSSEAFQETSETTDEDYHKVYEITENKLAYLLFSLEDGGDANETLMQNVATQFIQTTDFGTANISSVLSSLNSSHTSVTNAITGGAYNFYEDTDDEYNLNGFTYLGNDVFAAIVNNQYWKISKTGEIIFQSDSDWNFIILSNIFVSNGTLYGVGDGSVVEEINIDTGEVTNEEDKKKSFTWIGDVDLGFIDWFRSCFKIDDKIYAILNVAASNVLVELDIENLTIEYITTLSDEIQSVFLTSEIENNNGIGLGVTIEEDYENVTYYYYEEDAGYFFMHKSYFSTEPETSNLTLEYLNDEIWTAIDIVSIEEEAIEDTSATWYKFNFIKPSDYPDLRLSYEGSDYKVYIGAD